jgi:outer membrane protein TolC
VGKQWGAYLPVLYAEAGYVKQKVEFPAGQYGFAALRLNVPIFRSGEIGARVAQARAQKRQAEMMLEETRRTVREEVRVTMLDLEAARTNYQLAQEQAATAQEEYQQTFERYREQEATALDLEAAEASLADARRAVVSGRAGLRVAELRAWAAAGSLQSALVGEEAK